MRNVVLIARSTLYTVPGGDTVQLCQTAKYLAMHGYDADIILTNEKPDHQKYHLIHFFNITRPADILYHLKQARVPVVLTPILIDYSEYDRGQRKGIAGTLLRSFPPAMTEYVKTMGRWVRGKDRLRSVSYLWKGQERSIRSILERTDLLLPNAVTEELLIRKKYGYGKASAVIPNGIDPELFQPRPDIPKEAELVICAARIEGIKNQLNLIKALNHTRYTVVLIGRSAPNQPDYYKACRTAAAQNIQFHDHLPQEELAKLYARASVHVLPSWYETCGLSSLEAAAMGCKIVITDKGFTRDHFGDEAFYADPGDPLSIRAAVDQAATATIRTAFQQRILKTFTWPEAARQTASAYDKILSA